VLAVLTTWVLPIAALLVAAGLVVDVARGGRLPRWYFGIPLVFFAGDALVGENRPAWERVRKDVVVLLVAVACLVAGWRNRRARRIGEAAS
jgi:hypothetical protein